MTCIAAFISSNSIYMGCDSACTNTSSLQQSIMASNKIIQHGNMLVGFGGSLRLGQLVEKQLYESGMETDDCTLDFMIDVFIPEIRTALVDGGIVKDEGVQEFDGQLLVGLGNKLFEVQADFSVIEIAGNIAAIGTGADLVIGALAYFEENKDELHTPEGDIPLELRDMIENAAKYNAGVAKPVHVFQTNYTDNKGVVTCRQIC